ncbi:ATP-binding protein [Aerosakkonemataceae cyanobacterium BLCC-F50]|uniref:histidine kinase n=1 Tax=Floridaenema flaviceps BLCC-F50 TaxID=3153642 RepID=A0ABV4Y1T7_9CYAN
MAKNFLVLVVDDNAVERRAVCQCLRDTDELLELYEASDFAEALVILQAQKLDCVFLDESLLDAQGLGLLERLSAVDVRVPIVVLTNEEDEATYEQLLRMGVSDYVSKAKVSALLKSNLAHLMRLYGAKKRLLLEYKSAKDDRLKSWDNLSVDLGEETDPQFKITEKLRRAIAILGQQQQQLMTLQRLTNLLNQRLANLSNLLQFMVQSVCDAIPKAQFSLLVLHNPQCNRLMLSVTAGVGTEKLRLEDAFGKGEGWLAKVASTGFLQHIEGRDDLPACVYAVPIESAQAGRLGLLAIGNWDNTNAFSKDEQKLLIAVGEQAAIAINNARIIRILEEREERLAIQNEILARQNEELENQRQKIHLQNLQLLEAAKLKSQFLATVSHELRTPMNAVIGFSQLLLRQMRNKKSDSEFSPEQMSMLERILNNGKHLLGLINDILDLSKIEAGRMNLQRQQFNLESLVRETSEEARLLAEEKQIDLQLSANLSNPIIINDPHRLKQVVMNLLSNAIKFTSAGKVEIEVFEIDSMRLAIRVTDTGIGIAESDLKNIFAEFWQVDQSITKKHYGTGLGLAIIKSLVELMKGKVNVTSELGKGSCFQVEIPRHIPQLNHTSKCGRRLLR